MTNHQNSSLTAKYDEERSRVQEQSQIVSLQSQIDELRRLIKDQNNKYQWAVEQTRKTEAVLAQVQGLLEQHREEVTQSVERSRRDVVELRKEVAAAHVKIDEGIKPIRDMIAQIHQVAEARKQDREQLVPWFARIEDVEQQAQVIQTMVKEAEDRQRQLGMQLDRLRDADAAAIQEVRRVNEDLQVEKQSLRRQVVEAQQMVEGVHEVLHTLDTRISRGDDLHQELDNLVQTLPGQITEVAAQIETLPPEIKRVELAATDWFMLHQERLEDLRQQSNTQFDELRDVDVQHLNQLTSWLERLDAWVRELEQRVTRGISRLETTHQENISRLVELERREMHVIHALSAAFTGQVDYVRTEQERHRSAE